ncbi:hypothetical protein IGB42_02769 [Andreprevotia sp. IGB-42]|uniref:hypothetical protein n=1 Tax=Andreprevotia sp. IGB-42 TaxID=2497473 RepID=UPI00135A8B69|nr:hypothetical protein [Andreprevotia sp. IGB-42]KAF0812921.1 hypothetical protein IGB42_02769 [Andreprevotia sp. IGB-42]
MSLLNLDFHRISKPTPWIGLILVALGVVAMLWVMTQQDVVAQYKEQVETQESQLKWKKQQLAERQKEEQKETPVNEKVAIIRRAQQQSALPALKLLEASWSRDIAVLRMDLSPVDRNVKLDIESRDAGDLLSWIDRVNRQPGIARVVLARQQVKAADPFKPTQAGVEIYLRKDPQLDPRKVTKP